MNVSRESLKRMPISIGGIILGITAMGNLLHDYIFFSRELCGIISVILFILVVLKLAYYPETFMEDLKNPILASVIATLSMALMLIASYIEVYVGCGLAIFLWFIAIGIHLFFLINYIYRFVYNFRLSNFTAGSFVVFAGVEMIAITSPTFNMEKLGIIAFWFSFICVCFVFIVVCYRYLSIPVNQATKPILGVYAAPFSLCCIGYLSVVIPESLMFVLSMFILTKILYVMVLVKFIEYVRKIFYPTFAGYTFPVIINAVTTLGVMKYLIEIGYHIAFLQYELYIEIIIGLLLVIYVLYNYMKNMFIYNDNKNSN